MTEIKLTREHLLIGQRAFTLNRIQSVWGRKLTWKCQFTRMLAIMFQYSAVGWAIQYWLMFPEGWGLVLPLSLIGIGALYYLVTLRRFELKALLTAVDETGEQPITLASSMTKSDWARFQDFEAQFQSRS
ncbi:DUF6232 family protein [Photobacterium sp. 53610]|uniref:DUF6232 family protein n=1 Tax=Photobacterium sp. 53610 TaxID=3102789 RepID=UPI002ED944BE